jgi:2-iminoacetate synthase ThiH
VHWLLELAQHHAKTPLPSLPHVGPCSLAPFSTDAAGTHRLWAIAVARLVLPAAIRVEARHDLIGIRLAQVALGFGADTIAGPIAPERHLPVAGVPRPDETTITGLHKLIEQAGLECALYEDIAPRVYETGQQTVRIKIADLDLRPPSARGKQEDS